MILQNEMTQELRRVYGVVFVGLLALQLITYSYFFTSLIFTNHTFPNSWLFPYPSYKTQGEGRWVADLIIWLQGGSGVQPFQMAIAVALQSLNGILFARFVGLEKRLEVFLAAAFLCLYPAFLDYYSFAMDHITLVIGDTFTLLGICYWKRMGHSARNAAVSGLLFVLALACYQPKIGLIGLLCVTYLALWIATNDKSQVFSLRQLLRETAYVASVFIGACLAYFLSTKLTITYNVGGRAYINSIPEMLASALAAQGEFFRYFTVGTDYLPRLLRVLPALGIALGCLALLQRARRKHWAAVIIVAILLLLIPVTLRASYIVNKNSWENAGRITFANGYALLFFLSCALQAVRMRYLAAGILTTCVYFFLVLGTQESSTAALKTIYDLNMINRIASRIESVVADLYQNRYPLVVVGHYPEFERSRYVRTPNRNNAPHVESFAFEAYRQPEILNYFFGQEILLRPTPVQLEKALSSVEGRRPWPARESVYLVDNVIVVILERYGPGMPTTWTTEQ